jgi:transposase
MQPKSQGRIYSAEFKAQVLAECEHPGASEAAIVLAHGLNVNLLREWLVGRTIKRTGLAAPRSVTHRAASVDDMSAPALQSIPVEIVPSPVVASAATAPEQAGPPAAEIHADLTRGATRLSVRWPSAQTAACTAWLRELTAVALMD